MRITSIALTILLASVIVALAADHPDAARYSREQRAAMNALVNRVCPVVDTVPAHRFLENTRVTVRARGDRK